MGRIFITGSADGLGQMAANSLIDKGHEVILHARNAERARSAQDRVPGSQRVLIADLSDMEQTKQLASEVNAIGGFDAIIHNAGVYQVSNKLTFRVNSLAPYILTSLIRKPNRLVYLSSGMHRHGEPNVRKLSLDAGCSYSDSKLHVLLLTKAIARKWPGVYANAVDPGWVPTKMGGRNAPDDLQKGVDTQVWLAVSNEDTARVSGHYFHHKKEDRYLREADDINLQDNFLTRCEEITGVRFPGE